MKILNDALYKFVLNFVYGALIACFKNFTDKQKINIHIRITVVVISD